MHKKSYTVKKIDIEHIDGMTDVHMDAFTGNLLTKLGKSVVKRYYLWQYSEIEKYEKEIHGIGVFDNDELVAFTIFGIARNAKIGFLRKNYNILAFYFILSLHKFDLNDLKESCKNLSYLITKIFFSKKKKESPNKLTCKPSYGILVTACKKFHEGRGFGTLLMKNAEKIAKIHSTSLSLSVRQTNINAWKIYEALGYKKIIDKSGNWISQKMIKQF